MRLLRRLLGRTQPDLPASRSPEDADLDSLLALVAETMGFTCVFADDGTSLTLGATDETPESGRVVNLVGLRREAARRAREDWPMLVSEHLAHAVSGEPFDACNLAPIRPLLRTRVHAADDPAIPDPSRIIGRHLSADLIEVLTIGARPVRPEEAFCWPIPPGEALDLALDNALADERPTTEWLDLGGTRVSLLTAPSAAAHLRRLADHVLVPSDGALAVLPHRGAVAVHPVAGIGVVRAIERLRLFAQREFETRDDGISPHVYWWHRSRLTRIQADLITHDGQTRLVVAPPPEFARLLARIAGSSG
ncbi:hypothetical protein [Planotetraspora kaengkrachanensis]|uniref:Uncharacterized protein n=1 Tax=Planotetraspora kaengkrachanensis TaxID=575193 RepID=A0A8J3PXR6_9ACTN|nr:hypothetical protein [Planotetraspora kaengkrachanensis]GIG82821.1 hypothetical protein Pka01_59480 [Planotetraspora kaengkrachanensis]